MSQEILYFLLNQVSRTSILEMREWEGFQKESVKVKKWTLQTAIKLQETFFKRSEKLSKVFGEVT